MLFIELTSLRKGENETITDCIIRAETAAKALKCAVISDNLLIAMVLKAYYVYEVTNCSRLWLMQKEKQMTFSDFKTALRNYEENEKGKEENVI